MSFGYNDPPVGIERPLYAAMRALNAVLGRINARLQR
jgi:hypothetical protein